MASALVHLAFTARAGVARGTGARETGDAIHTAPMVAWVWRAVIHVVLTHRALEACGDRGSGSAHWPRSCPQPWLLPNSGSALPQARPIEPTGGGLSSGPAPECSSIPSSYRLQGSSLARTLPQLNPTPSVTLLPILTLSALICLALPWKWGHMGGAWGCRGSDPTPPVKCTPILLDPLASPPALPLLVSIIGSASWLFHWPC